LVKGKPVSLSTGISNSTPAEIEKALTETIPAQIAALREQGAKTINLMGVGSHPKLAGVNDRLAQIAKDNAGAGVTFSGAVDPVAGDQIHFGEKGAKAEMAKVRQALGSTAAAPSPAQPAGEPTPTTGSSTPPTTPGTPGLPTPPPPEAPYRPDAQIPALRSKLQEIDQRAGSEGWTPERYFNAYRLARERYNMAVLDEEREQRVAKQAEQQKVEHRTNDIYKDVYSDNPQITVQQIAVDPAFAGNPERRKQMIELVTNPPGTGLPPSQSYNTALGLINRIRLPDGDPDKITDIGQIYDQMRNMNRADFEFARKEFDQIRTPGGEMFNRRKGDFVKSITPQIDKSNPIMGTIDQTGREELYKFEWKLDRKIEEYRQAGKNPSDLLDPSKPEYMGKPEVVGEFQKPLTQSLREHAERLRAQQSAPAAPAPVASAPIPPAGTTGQETPVAIQPPPAAPPPPVTIQPRSRHHAAAARREHRRL
jgi:hypothetical protein